MSIEEACIGSPSCSRIDQVMDRRGGTGKLTGLGFLANLPMQICAARSRWWRLEPLS
jgi:hypothetical protein